MDLRDKIAYRKEQGVQLVDQPNPSPTQQPAARKATFAEELHAEKQLDITARDPARLQRGGRAMNQESNSSTRRFDSATSNGEPETFRTMDKATVGLHYLSPVKKPASLTDRVPPWFETLRSELLSRVFVWVNGHLAQCHLA